MSEIVIPSFFVTASTYRLLQLSVSYRGKVFTPKSEIFKEEGLVIMIKADHRVERYLDLFFIPVLFVLFSISLFVASCSGMKRSSVHTINPSLLKRLPIVSYDQLKKGSGDEITCAICLEDFKSGIDLRVLTPCNHVYHSACIDRWLLLKSIQCPICQQKVGEARLKINLNY